MALLPLLVLITTAFAGRGVYFLEAEPSPTRPEAAEVVREATTRGWSARVVRRYRHGVGWEYVARVEGFEDEAPATEAATALGEALGATVTVYTTEALPTGSSAQAEPARRDPAPRPAAGVDVSSWSVAQWVERAGRAHGGASGGQAAVDAAERVLFRFRRQVPDGPLVEHTWARQGRDVFVQIEIVRGEGVSSRTWLVGGAAWLAVAGGAPTAQDATRTREALDKFSPHQTIGLPLRLGAAAGRTDLQLLHREGEVVVDGDRCERFRYDGGPGVAPMALAIDASDFLVREVETGGDPEPVSRRFGDYREVGADVIVPFSVRVVHGERIADAIEVLEFDLAPRLPGEWFAAPAR